LELLKNLQKIDAFRNLRLVGGTALALQIGHRKSIDIDLFGKIFADEYTVSEELARLGEIKIIQKTQHISVFLINGIKTDLVNYHYPWLEEEKRSDGLILAGIKDIAAMKLAAITGRGTKKDFIDLYFLLKQYSLSEMLDFYSKKYSDGSTFMVLKSLSYFDDAEKDPMPLMISEANWKNIKETLIKHLRKEFI
jgi:predicted nucleotidyltransferase component of viral defense system